VGLGGLFSVALSLGSRPPDVIRHRMPVGARTFLSSPPFGIGPSGPPGRLTPQGNGEGARRRQGLEENRREKTDALRERGCPDLSSAGSMSGERLRARKQSLQGRTRSKRR